MPNQSEHDDRSAPDGPKRRSFLSGMSTAAMTAGLVGGYGAFAFIAGRFLYPARAHSTTWMFVSEVDALQAGDSLRYRGPAGETVNITRQARSGAVEDFIALSSVCPHLGCKVHWEEERRHFLCPCHGGIFDSGGKATAGPPADEGTDLQKFELKRVGENLFIKVEEIVHV